MFVFTEPRQFHLKGKHNQKSHGKSAVSTPDISDVVRVKGTSLTAKAVEYMDYKGEPWLKLDKKLGNKQWHSADALEVVSKGTGINVDGVSTVPPLTPQTHPGLVKTSKLHDGTEIKAGDVLEHPNGTTWQVNKINEWGNPEITIIAKSPNSTATTAVGHTWTPNNIQIVQGLSKKGASQVASSDTPLPTWGAPKNSYSLNKGMSVKTPVGTGSLNKTVTDKDGLWLHVDVPGSKKKWFLAKDTQVGTVDGQPIYYGKPLPGTITGKTWKSKHGDDIKVGDDVHFDGDHGKIVKIDANGDPVVKFKTDGDEVPMGANQLSKVTPLGGSTTPTSPKKHPTADYQEGDVIYSPMDKSKANPYTVKKINDDGSIQVQSKAGLVTDYSSSAAKYMKIASPEEIATAQNGGFPTDLGTLVKTKQLGGSTGASLWQDTAGSQYVRKSGNSPEHIEAEFAANKVYKAAGVDVPEVRMYNHAGQPTQLSQFIDGKSLGDLDTGAQQAAFAQLRKNFIADAVLGNRDVLGMDLDNVIVDKNGKVWRIDNGSSFDFRAQGGKKDFPPTADEIDSMRDPKRSSSKVYGAITTKEMYDQALELQARKTEILAATPEKYRDVLNARIDHAVSHTAKLYEAEGGVTKKAPGMLFHPDDDLPVSTSTNHKFGIGTKGLGPGTTGHYEVVSHNYDAGGQPHYTLKKSDGSIVGASEATLQSMVKKYTTENPGYTPPSAPATNNVNKIKSVSGEEIAVGQRLKFKGDLDEEHSTVLSIDNGQVTLKNSLTGAVGTYSKTELESPGFGTTIVPKTKKIDAVPGDAVTAHTKFKVGDEMNDPSLGIMKVSKVHPDGTYDFEGMGGTKFEKIKPGVDTSPQAVVSGAASSKVGNTYTPTGSGTSNMTKASYTIGEFAGTHEGVSYHIGDKIKINGDLATVTGTHKNGNLKAEFDDDKGAHTTVQHFDTVSKVTDSSSPKKHPTADYSEGDWVKTPSGQSVKITKINDDGSTEWETVTGTKGTHTKTTAGTLDKAVVHDPSKNVGGWEVGHPVVGKNDAVNSAQWTVVGVNTSTGMVKIKDKLGYELEYTPAQLKSAGFVPPRQGGLTSTTSTTPVTKTSTGDNALSPGTKVTNKHSGDEYEVSHYDAKTDIYHMKDGSFKTASFVHSTHTTIAKPTSHPYDTSEIGHTVFAPSGTPYTITSKSNDSIEMVDKFGGKQTLTKSEFASYSNPATTQVSTSSPTPSAKVNTTPTYPTLNQPYYIPGKGTGTVVKTQGKWVQIKGAGKKEWYTYAELSQLFGQATVGGVPGEKNFKSTVGTPSGTSWNPTPWKSPAFAPQWRSWAETLTNSEKSAIERYTGTTGFQYINDYLRGKTSHISNSDRSAIASLDSALARGRFPEDTLLYRGVSHNTAKQFSDGGKFFDSGYASTSTSESFATSWKPVLVKIRVPGGTAGGFVSQTDPKKGQYSSLSAQGNGEREIILPRNLTYRVLGHTKVGNKDVWEMEVVDD